MIKTILRNFSSCIRCYEPNENIYLESRNKEFSLYLSKKEMLETNVAINKLLNVCVEDCRYSLLTRVSYINISSISKYRDIDSIDDLDISIDNFVNNSDVTE